LASEPHDSVIDNILLYGKSISPDMSWGSAPQAYPSPHLMTCSYERSGVENTTVRAEPPTAPGPSRGAATEHGHRHDHETAPAPADAQPMDGLERFTLHSAGLDVGSATSHLTISRVVFKRRGAELSNRWVVVERTELYRSDVALTPYRTDGRIDADWLQDFFDDAYRRAGFTPSDVDTGVVIVTGEAANRPNAEELATRFAARAGSFMCVAAGPHYEALLAAHGSGAVTMSTDTTVPVLNVDIGGGTTKLSVVTSGAVLHTGAFSVGARLVAFDDAGRLTRVEPPGRLMLDRLGSTAEVGDVLSAQLRDELAELMTELLLQVVLQKPRDPLLARLWVTDDLAPELFSGIGTITFSGGVSEYIYGHDSKDYGDLGLRMGNALRRQLDVAGRASETLRPSQGIRATVLGAGQHSVQASGVTSFADEHALPAAGLKVVAARVDEPAGLGQVLASTAKRFELDGANPRVAYSLTIHPPIDYRMLRRVAEEVAFAAEPDRPLFVIVDADVAHALGRILRVELGWSAPLVVVDGVGVGDLDYVDIGRPLGAGMTIPVTVKSLTFLTR
jgi:ethanolamine utilization protein EutA